SIERALICSTVAHVPFRYRLGVRFASRGIPPSLEITDISEQTLTCSQGRLMLGKRVAVAVHDAFDHGLLGEMQENAVAERLGALLRSGRIVQCALDRVRDRAHQVRREQRVGVRPEYLG